MSRKSKRAERLKLAKEFAQDQGEGRKVRLIPRDLKLIRVPEPEREAIRIFLAPLLRKVIIKAQDCWNVGQQLVIAASSPRVAYVEGVYQGKESINCDCECCRTPKPHAWNTVDGHIVDLSVEHRAKFSGWIQEDRLWEAHKSFTIEDIRRYEEEITELDGFAITPVICLEGYAEDFGLTFSDEDYERIKDADKWEEPIFKAAADRLIAQHKTTEDLTEVA
jgi:hypothetical protein